MYGFLKGDQNLDMKADHKQTVPGLLARAPKASLPRRLFRMLLFVILVPAAGFGGYIGYLKASGNVHVIEPGVAIRSAELSRDQLQSVIDEYGVRSIISLVRPDPKQSWYRGELAVSASRHLVRYELPLSATIELSSGQLAQLLSILQSAPKPVLIHCKSGSDRSGLAAAILEYAISSRPLSESRQQLSLRYGHFPYLWSRTGAMDASFAHFVSDHPR
jgi:protein tyrosine phosphatase (PTP) superfamily phosphohydrolase (DUF442 family)